MPIDSSRILFQDEHLLIVNKLSGELVVQGKGRLDKLPLLDFLKKDFPGLRAVHRLDFETSGIVVFAKTKNAYELILNKKLDQEKPDADEDSSPSKAPFEGWKKVYRTLVMGRLERKADTIRIPLPAHTSKFKGRSGKKKETLLESETKYFVLDRFANSSYIECEIKTGRHHQIRKHLAAIHHPLALDDIYGHEKFNKVFTQEFHLRKFFLHASAITFPHPITGKEIHVEAPLPRQFEQIVKKLQSLR